MALVGNPGVPTRACRKLCRHEAACVSLGQKAAYASSKGPKNKLYSPVQRKPLTSFHPSNRRPPLLDPCLLHLASPTSSIICSLVTRPGLVSPSSRPPLTHRHSARSCLHAPHRTSSLPACHSLHAPATPSTHFTRVQTHLAPPGMPPVHTPLPPSKHDVRTHLAPSSCQSVELVADKVHAAPHAPCQRVYQCGPLVHSGQRILGVGQQQDAHGRTGRGRCSRGRIKLRCDVDGLVQCERCGYQLCLQVWT
eukprot:362027-Chlamydomonas_euryale.AAC.2